MKNSKLSIKKTQGFLIELLEVKAMDDNIRKVRKILKKRF